MRSIVFLILLLNFFVLNISSQDYNTTLVNDITFSWRIIDKSMDIILKAPTKGWISVGFNPSSKMKDADYVLGCVKKGEVFFIDAYGSGLLSHRSDTELGGSDNITNKYGEENKNETLLKFTIPTNSDDRYDKILSKGKHVILLAYSLSDDFKSKHVKKARLEIEIE